LELGTAASEPGYASASGFSFFAVNNRLVGNGDGAISRVSYNFDISGSFNPIHPTATFTMYLAAVRGFAFGTEEIQGSDDPAVFLRTSHDVGLPISDESELRPFQIGESEGDSDNFFGILQGHILGTNFACLEEAGPICASGSYDLSRTLSFDVAEGESFFLMSFIGVEELEGNLNFFDTVRLNSVHVPSHLSLISDGTALTRGGDGLYRLEASVPEPTTWVMLISGFGLVGATLRRQSRSKSQGASAHSTI
jgi:hypothetical protein